MSRVAESFQRPPRSATRARRAPSQADSESKRRPSRSKMTAAIGPEVKAGDQGIEPRPAVLETAILAVGPVPRAGPPFYEPSPVPVDRAPAHFMLTDPAEETVAAVGAAQRRASGRSPCGRRDSNPQALRHRTL